MVVTGEYPVYFKQLVKQCLPFSSCSIERNALCSGRWFKSVDQMPCYRPPPTLPLVQHKRGQHCRLLSEFGKVFVCDGCSPPANDIEWLIVQSGGEVTNDPCECVLVVAPHDHSLEILCSEEVEFPPPVVVEKYILDCISENKILGIDGYMEHDVVDEIC
ncbi:BRCT domain-containing protein [Trichostrongylus colubriformis]|uniref:BRCT domain-containing protein n=1 Tax=Trichostrongylus colubriformis TaxID=6319 RepID=A0AAN8J1X9_TRICO